MWPWEYEKERIKEFQAKYDVFVRQHGELYEKKLAPMDEADIRKVKGFYLFVQIFLSLFVILCGVLLYFNFPHTIEDRLIASAMIVALVTGLIWSYSSRKKTLTNNVKTVIKGVITSQRRVSKKNGFDYKIQISGKEEETITRKDYNKLALGDIIQMELLGNPGFSITNAKVSMLGKVPIDREEKSTATDSSGGSSWARAGRYLGKRLFKNK